MSRVAFGCVFSFLGVDLVMYIRYVFCFYGFSYFFLFVGFSFSGSIGLLLRLLFYFGFLLFFIGIFV